MEPLDLPQLPEDGLEQEGEQERPEGVPLLDASLAAQGGVPEVQVGVLGVARSDPGVELGEVLPNFRQHGLPVPHVEAVGEVYEEGPLLLLLEGVVTEGLPGGMHHRLAPAPDPHPKLVRHKVGLRLLGHLPSQALPHHPPDDLAHSHRPQLPPTFFLAAKRLAPVK